VQRGNATNHSVWSVEKITWQGLIKIALGSVSIETGVAEIAEMIQKEAYGYVSPTARSWYNLKGEIFNIFKIVVLSNPSDNKLENFYGADGDFFNFLKMWPLSSISQMPSTPLPLTVTLPQKPMDLPSLVAALATALTCAPAEPLDKASQPELEDIEMTCDSLRSIDPQALLLSSTHQFLQQEVNQPPPYCDLDSMEIDDPSQAPSAPSPYLLNVNTETTHDAPTQANNPHLGKNHPTNQKQAPLSPAGLIADAQVDEDMVPPSTLLDGNSEIDTTQYDASTQGNDPHLPKKPPTNQNWAPPSPAELITDAQVDEDMVPSSTLLDCNTEIDTTQYDAPSQANDLGKKPPTNRKRPPPSPARLSTDAQVDEDMVPPSPPSGKRRCLTDRNPTSSRFRPSRPQTSHSGTSLGKKVTKVRPYENGPLREASAFHEMKETIMRDLTTEYVCSTLINRMIFELIHA
jgi:hypothetical protein